MRRILIGSVFVLLFASQAIAQKEDAVLKQKLRELISNFKGDA